MNLTAIRDAADHAKGLAQVALRSSPRYAHRFATRRPKGPALDSSHRFARPDVDYADIAAERAYPDADVVHFAGFSELLSARAAYARAYSDGLEAATP